MSDDYWSSPDAAIHMGYIGKSAGLAQGREEGYQNGFEHGRTQGFHEGAAAMQERTDATIAQMRAEISTLCEFSNGSLITLDAAVEVLVGSGNQKLMSDFIVSYARRVENSVNARHIPVAPHADERFATRMPRVTQIIRETLTRLLGRW